MNLLKINEILTKAMIGTFVSIVAFTFLALALPILVYVVAVLLLLLLGTVILNSVVSGILMAQEINKMIDQFFKQYEQAH